MFKIPNIRPRDPHKIATTTYVNEVAEAVRDLAPDMPPGLPDPNGPLVVSYVGKIAVTGPVGDEADFGGPRYWVTLQGLNPVGTGGPGEAASWYEDHTWLDDGSAVTVVATNLIEAEDEAGNGTHALAPGRLVRVYPIASARASDGETFIRYVFEADPEFMGSVVCRGPGGEEDFSDNRYWVQIKNVGNTDADSSSAISLTDAPVNDVTARKQIVCVTNLGEANSGTHNVLPGTPLKMHRQLDRGDPPLWRYVTSYLDENPGSLKPCTESSESSSSSTDYRCFATYLSTYDCDTGIWGTPTYNGSDCLPAGTPTTWALINDCVAQIYVDLGTSCTTTGECAGIEASSPPALPTLDAPDCCGSSSGPSESSVGEMHCYARYYCTYDCDTPGWGTPVYNGSECLPIGQAVGWQSLNDCSVSCLVDTGNVCTTDGECAGVEATPPALPDPPAGCCASSSGSSTPSSSTTSSTSSEPPSSTPSEPPPPSSGSDKSTAIVPASWSSTGFVSMFVREDPIPMFQDRMIVTVNTRTRMVQIDPRFIELSEPGTLEVQGKPSTILPTSIGAVVDGAYLRLRFTWLARLLYRREKIRLVIDFSAVRKGMADKRYKERTREQFDANEAFIKSAYPGAGE